MQSGYREFLPPRADATRIAAFWTSFAATPARHTVFPDGCMDLIVRCRCDSGGRIGAAKLSIVGTMRAFACVEITAGEAFLGLRFRPGWGGVCLGVSASELCDQTMDDLAVRRILPLVAARLDRAATSAELVAAFVDIGCRLAAGTQSGIRESGVLAALDLLWRSGGRLPIGALCRRIDMPVRTLQRQTVEATGLSPKFLGNVLRFQRTLDFMRARRSAVSLADAAIAGGYADQAHMTRAFRRLGGLTPAKLADLFKMSADSEGKDRAV
jgi:AraC-like DNA-binding protein